MKYILEFSQDVNYNLLSINVSYLQDLQLLLPVKNLNSSKNQMCYEHKFSSLEQTQRIGLFAVTF